MLQVMICNTQRHALWLVSAKLIQLSNGPELVYWKTAPLLDPNQSAYRKYHSTTTALLKITDDILESIEDSEVSIMVFLDFSKAFDTVNHRLLLEKLKILGFDGSSCDWIKSYLSNRYQRVKQGDNVSGWKKSKMVFPRDPYLDHFFLQFLHRTCENVFILGTIMNMLMTLQSTKIQPLKI